MTKILKSEEFINEQVVNEMGMRVRNRNIQQRISDQLKKYNLVYNEETGLHDCNGDVKVEQDLVSPNGKLVVKFGVVKGDFDCSYINLTSLEGTPQEVGGDFDCGENQLTSLEGAPQEVGGSFGCSNNQLISLKGAPQEVSGSFWCRENQLTSLEGAPQVVGGRFDCGKNQLTSLEGAPQKVGGDFKCSANNLVFDETHFYGCLPDVIGGDLDAGLNCNYKLAKDYYDNE